jgi:peptidoglycan/LPS O-acetylase OafA/YrhL
MHSVASLADSNASALELPKYRPDIDGLRAVAVLAVVAFHAFPGAVPGGFVGVDVFFVVSGYLISTILFTNLERGTFSLAEFYARRIRRIFPALALVLSATLILGWALLFADELKQLGKHAAGGAGFVSNFVLWGEAGYFDEAAEAKPLLHLWSLGIEEQFYLLWPPLLWLAWRRRRAVPAMAALVAAASFAACLWLVRDHPVAAFFNPLTRLWELLVGAMLARGTLRDGWGSPELRASLGISMIAAGIALTLPETSFPSAWTLLPVLGAAFVISSGTGAWLNRRVLAQPVLAGIGLISYPLYLWHWPLLSLARIVEGAEPPAAMKWAIVAASAVLAWLTYRLVERPLRFGPAPKAAVGGLCAAMLLAGLAGYACWRLDGAPSREAAQLQALNRFDRPYQQDCRDLMGSASAEDWCNRGNNPRAAPSIVMLGDSYGNSFAPMLAALLDGADPRLAFRQFGRQQCPMLRDFGRAECREIAGKALAYVAATPAVRTVVLASNWPIYHPGPHPGWREPAAEEGDFPAALERTVAELRRGGKRVVVFLAPPVGSRPRACVVRRVQLSDDDHCALPLEVAQGRDGTYRTVFLPRLERLGLAFFDPFPYFCDRAACRVMDGRRILSADGYHLSAYGGEYLARQARDELLEVLGVRGSDNIAQPKTGL